MPLILPILSILPFQHQYYHIINIINTRTILLLTLPIPTLSIPPIHVPTLLSIRQVVGKSWQTFSKTRWFSRQDVLGLIRDHFHEMQKVLGDCVAAEAAVASSFKAKQMLDNEETYMLLEIELCAMIEGLLPLYQMVYDLEGDGHLIFKVANWMRRIQRLRAEGEGDIPKLTSIGPLIEKAVGWVQSQDCMRQAAFQAQPTVEQVRASAGRKPSKNDFPHAESHDGSHAPNSRSRETGDAAAKYAAALAEWEAKLEELQIQAAQNFRIPHTAEGWHAHISRGILPAYQYLDGRLEEDADRSRALKLCVAAELFVPQFARTLSKQAAYEHIDQLRLFDKLNNDSMINGLKQGWHAFKYYACNEKRPRGQLDVLQWHYDRQELRRSSPNANCKACQRAAHANCCCEQGLPYYYKAVKLLVLLQPSSAGAERVFSVLKRYFDEQQESSLTDAIRVAVFLEVNKRPLV